MRTVIVMTCLLLCAAAGAAQQAPVRVPNMPERMDPDLQLPPASRRIPPAVLDRGCNANTAGCNHNPQSTNKPAPAAKPEPTPTIPPATTAPTDPFGPSAGTRIDYQTPELLTGDGDNSPRDGTFEPTQLLVWHPDMDSAQAFAQAAAQAGYRVRGRRLLAGLGAVQSILAVPQGLPVAKAMTQLRARFPQAVIDLNHRYRLLGADPALTAVGWTPQTVACVHGGRIGIVDTGITSTNPLLASRRVGVRSMLSAGITPAPTGHGTAVAARLAQLLPSAELRVAAVFRLRDEEIVDTTAQWLLQALNWLALKNVTAINLSLGGPSNRLLAIAVQQLRKQNISLVAAAAESGVNGPPVYPAAYPAVIAATAVDVQMHVYVRARHGPQIDFAAPGVDLRVPGIKRYLTGTSHAAPFVTAALVAAGGSIRRLTAAARDLGAPGRDNTFGNGFVDFTGLCGANAG